MKNQFKTLAIRALNSCHLDYPPSYLGIRLFADTLYRSDSMEWGIEYITRKLFTRKNWPYHHFCWLKNLSKSGVCEYRNYMIGSPTTILIESFVLQLLSDEAIFKPHISSYSYLWPESNKSGRNFEYYFKGYNRRNLTVLELLRANHKNVAYVFDIKKFYPSISQDILLPRIDKRLSKMKNNVYQKEIYGLIKGLLDISQGIPIGPQISHLLGHIALEDVDQKMHQVFGRNYLRYVDDIIIVSNKKNRNKILTLLKSALDEENLTLNEDKTDEVSLHCWQNGMPKIDSANDINTFRSLKFFLAIFINIKPMSYENLRKQFLDNGFSLPFLRFKSLSKYDSFIHYIKNFIRSQGRNYGWLLRGIILSETKLLKIAMNVRQKMMYDFDHLTRDTVPSGGIQRRWYAQRMKCLINHLLYLLPISKYNDLLLKTPDIDELQENRSLMKAFITEDVTDLLRLPGRVMLAFCERWIELKNHPPNINFDTNISEIECNSLEILSLYGIVDVPQNVINSLPDESKAMLNCYSGNTVDENHVKPLSYLDELRSLMMRYNKEEIYDLLTTRFSVEEDVDLCGLHVGGSGYLS